MKKIGIIIAVEITGVMRKYADSLVREEVKGFEVYSIDFGDKIMYIAKSEVGEIRAAACTQMLISRFGVDLVVNFGVVGALRDEIKLLNTCVVDKIVHYDMDTSAVDKCEVGRYLEYDDIYLRTTKKYIEMAIKHNPNMRVVTCASADKFIVDAEKKKEIADLFDADICDMESAGIILVCDQNKVPNLFIKTISDSIHGGAEEFKEYKEKAADLCMDIIDSIILDME
jgi:hypothetical protein